jgi:hypothetical protein
VTNSTAVQRITACERERREGSAQGCLLRHQTAAALLWGPGARDSTRLRAVARAEAAGDRSARAHAQADNRRTALFGFRQAGVSARRGDVARARRAARDSDSARPGRRVEPRCPCRRHAATAPRSCACREDPRLR